MKFLQVVVGYDLGSLDCSIWHPFCSFSYSRVYQQRLQLSSMMSQLFKKSSSQDGKFTFQGWYYFFPRTLSPKLQSLATTQYEAILQPIQSYLKEEKRILFFQYQGIINKKVKCIKSGGKSRFSLTFLTSTVNDVRRKLYTDGIHLTVGKQAKRMPNTTVKTTILAQENFVIDVGQTLGIFVRL